MPRQRQNQSSDSPPSKQELAGIAEPTPPVPDYTISIALAQAESDRQDAEQARDQRREYARKIFVLVSVWLSAITYIVLAQGFGYGSTFWLAWFFGVAKFNLSDSVMIALLTTSTATVIGIFVVVVRNLFPRK